MMESEKYNVDYTLYIIKMCVHNISEQKVAQCTIFADISCKYLTLSFISD